MVVDSFPGKAAAFLIVSLAWQQSGGGGVPQIWLDRNVGCTLFAAGFLLTVAALRGNCLSFFLLVVFRSGAGSWEGSIF